MDKFKIFLAKALKELILITAGVHIALLIGKQNYGFYLWFYGFIAVGMYIIFSYLEQSYKKIGGKNGKKLKWK